MEDDKAEKSSEYFASGPSDKVVIKSRDGKLFSYNDKSSKKRPVDLEKLNPNKESEKDEQNGAPNAKKVKTDEEGASDGDPRKKKASVGPSKSYVDPPFKQPRFLNRNASSSTSKTIEIDSDFHFDPASSSTQVNQDDTRATMKSAFKSNANLNVPKTTMANVPLSLPIGARPLKENLPRKTKQDQAWIKRRMQAHKDEDEEENEPAAGQSSPSKKTTFVHPKKIGSGLYRSDFRWKSKWKFQFEHIISY